MLGRSARSRSSKPARWVRLPQHGPTGLVWLSGESTRLVSGRGRFDSVMRLRRRLAQLAERPVYIRDVGGSPLRCAPGGGCPQGHPAPRGLRPCSPLGTDQHARVAQWQSTCMVSRRLQVRFLAWAQIRGSGGTGRRTVSRARRSSSCGFKSHLPQFHRSCVGGGIGRRTRLRIWRPQVVRVRLPPCALVVSGASPPAPRGFVGARFPSLRCGKRGRIGFADSTRPPLLGARWGCRPGLAASPPGVRCDPSLRFVRGGIGLNPVAHGRARSARAGRTKFGCRRDRGDRRRLESG